MQMLPWRVLDWDGGGGGGCPWVGTGYAWSILTMWMLELSMGATEVEVVARATAVRNWSESAAFWALRLWPINVGVLFCE